MPFEYKYERGEGRFKHCWNKDEAGFEPSPKGQVGKCHSSINDVVAEDLLKNGIAEIPIDEDSEFDFPERIFNVYRGVPYVAVQTQPGVSYHGYPWRGRMSGSVKRELEERVSGTQDARIFKKWMKEYCS